MAALSSEKRSFIPSIQIRRVLPAAIAIVLVLLAFGLRVYAVRWGLPYTDHPDEPSAANRALNMLRRGNWNPDFFGKPALYYDALRVVFAAHLRYGIATGLYTSIKDLPRTTDQYLLTPELFVWGRMLTVMLGAASVWLVYRIGQRRWNVWAGLVAATLLAVLPFAVRHSQYITQDVPSAFMALAALWATLRILDRADTKDYALAGALIGLAGATKYNAGTIAIALVAAHIIVWRRASLRQGWRLVLAALCSGLAFVLVNPYFVLSFGRFVEGAKNQYEAYAREGSDSSGAWPWRDYAWFFWSEGMLPLPLIAALIGIALVVWRRDRAGLVVLAFVLPYPFYFLPQNVHFFRNMQPIIPPLCLLAGIAVSGVRNKESGGRSQESGAGRQKSESHIPSRAFRLLPSAFCLVLTAVLAWEPLLGSVELTRFYAQPHSKVRAGNYVHTLPHGAPIAVALNSAQWINQPFVTPVDDIVQHDAAWYREQGYRYLIANTKYTNDKKYAKLRAQAQVIATFPGDADGQPGPPMEALDLGAHPDDLAIEQRTAVFSDTLQLLGFQRGAGNVRAAFTPLDGTLELDKNHTLQLNLYWQTLAQPHVDYSIFLHLRDANGNVVAQRDTPIRAADYPTSHWQPGELSLDLADLYLPPDLPHGDYTLLLGVYRADTMERLPLPGAPDNALELLTVTIDT